MRIAQGQRLNAVVVYSSEKGLPEVAMYRVLRVVIIFKLTLSILSYRFAWQALHTTPSPSTLTTQPHHA